jgi:Co/Zn/Cd efflux system component
MTTPGHTAPLPALLSDAGHMLSDAGAITGALWAIRLAARPPPGRERSGGNAPRSYRTH